MSLKDTCVSAWEAVSVVIASGESLTGGINLGGLRLFGIVMPSTWTNADISFQTSFDNGTTWADLREQDGTEIIAAGQAGKCIVLLPSRFAAFQFIRLRSGTSVAPVAQSAERALQLIVRGV